MESSYDYKKFAILYVDDEEKSLKYFARAFEGQFRILTASNAQEGFKLLEAHQDQIGLLMSDQRMPGEKGIWLLEKARQLRPQIIRVLATAYSDMEAAISAVNTGAIYKYITKPWDPPQLESTLKRGLEFFMVQCERDHLLQEKMSVLHNMMIADRVVSLGLLAAGLSHHIRNSLVAVKTFLDLAPTKLREENLELDRLRNPDFWQEYYQKTQNQIEKIDNMLKDLWTAAETPAFQFNDRVQLHEVVRDVLEKLGPSFAGKQINVESNIPATLPWLSVDKPKFYKLFELLLRDEIVSLPPGSTIRISAQEGSRGSAGKPEIEVQIADNGPGLPKEALRLVFDPFVVRSDTPSEYGINLMASYFIVHHHGGKIEAKSEDGQGTIFILRLLVNPNDAPATEESQVFSQKVLLNDSLWKNLIGSD